jgi:hypothetical protein
MEHAIITKGHFESPDLIKLDEQIGNINEDIEIIIKPIKKIEIKRLSGTLKGKIHINKDFDYPLDDFKDYM